MLKELASLAGIDLDIIIEIYDKKNFQNKILSSGTLGLGESYMLGEWHENVPLDDLTYLACKAQLKEKLYESCFLHILFLVMMLQLCHGFHSWLRQL